MVKLLKGTIKINGMLMYKIKCNSDGAIELYITWLVGKGSSQTVE